MKKLVILSLIAPAVLGLAACGGAGNNTTADVNVISDDNTTTIVTNDAMIENAEAPANAM